MILVITGVSGSGKTTVGRAAAEKLGWRFRDADDLHDRAAVARIRAGLPLDDQMRGPWLQRVRDEIGVRMALGATRSNVVGMVMMRATVLVIAGLVVGTAAAWGLSGTASRFLFKLEHHDVRAFAVALVTLAVAALIASAIPARRAASVDPMIALRAE